jgi:hypothetical protein
MADATADCQGINAARDQGGSVAVAEPVETAGSLRAFTNSPNPGEIVRRYRVALDGAERENVKFRLTLPKRHPELQHAHGDRWQRDHAASVLGLGRFETKPGLGLLQAALDPDGGGVHVDVGPAQRRISSRSILLLEKPRIQFSYDTDPKQAPETRLKLLHMITANMAAFDAQQVRGNLASLGAWQFIFRVS